MRPIGFLFLCFVAACGPDFAAIRPSVVTPESAVRVTRISHFRTIGPGGTLFEVVVENRVGGVLRIDRDAILLVTPRGPRSRMPGGIHSIYFVPSGRKHRLRIAYWVADLGPMETVSLDLSAALTIDGRPAPVSPLVFAVR
jgi:hypothetical protein